MGGNIEVVTGISWFHDKLLEIMTARSEFLKEGIARGVPTEEYRMMVGKYREVQRFIQNTLPELFEEFYQAEESVALDGGLEELKDEQ